MKNSSKKRGMIWALVIATALLTFGGCARIGNEFSSVNVQNIKIGETTQNDIVQMFGQPWRTGVEDGVTMWTYGRYTYRIIGDTDTKDLVVKFDKQKKVTSYTFNETMNKE